jgi:hypothetical protein
MKHVCIKNCEKECFDGDMLNVIQKNFERHGLSTRVYSGDLPSNCEYYLTYYCKRSWDMATYMHHAELRLYHADDQIGYAEFHLKGEGGLAPSKWDPTEKKMAPVIDQLLKDYPLVSKGIYPLIFKQTVKTRPSSGILS